MVNIFQNYGNKQISILSLLWGLLNFRYYKKKSDDVFQETTEYEKGFAKYYEENLKPKISESEEERLNILRNAAKKIRYLLLIFISIPIIFFLLASIFSDFIPFYELMGLLQAFFIFPLLIYIGLFYLLSLPTLRKVRDFQSSNKSEFFSIILKFLGDFSFDAKPSISVSQFKSTGLIPGYRKEVNEDFIEGDYKGVKIKLFESILSRTETNSDLFKKERDPKQVTVITFQGLFVIFQMNKNFKGKTIVSDGTANIQGLKEVILEDPEFKNIWDVHSDDQIEARYLLTVTFMERFKELNTFISQFNDYSNRETITSGLKRRFNINRRFYSSTSLRIENPNRLQCCF